MAAPTVKSKLTCHHILSRWFALISGIFGTLAATCVAKIVTAYSGTAADVHSATYTTGILLTVFMLLASIFWVYKKKLHAASEKEAAGGVLDMTPSDIVALTVDEALANLTSAIASILAGIWFGLVPVTMDKRVVTMIMLGGGAVVLVIGEFIQLRFAKGTVGNYMFKSLNGMNCGSVSWWVGYSMSHPEGWAPAGLQYWIWFVNLVIAGVSVEVLDMVSAKCCKSGEESPYGAFLFKMLKGIPVYSSCIILNAILQNRCMGDYVQGCIIWVCVSSTVVIALDQFVHRAESGLRPSRWYADEKMIFTFVNDLVALVQQSFAFIGGGLAISAMPQFLNADIAIQNWIGIAVGFQVVSFALQTARLRLIKTATVKAASAREQDYIKLAA